MAERQKIAGRPERYVAPKGAHARAERLASTAQNHWNVSLLEVFDRVAREIPSIEINPKILGGTPIIRGTRISVNMVIRAVESYGTVEDAVRCYPALTSDQVRDAMYFARMVLESPVAINETTSPSG